MFKTITVKKGFDIKLKGLAQNRIDNPIVQTYAVKPTDYLGITPKLLVQQGDKIKAGSPLFYSKQNPDLLFTSPVSGEVLSIVRGEKRRIEEIQISAEKEQEYEDFGEFSLEQMSKQEVVEKLLQTGLFSFIRQRPYSVIPKAEIPPKAVIISAFDSSPLACDYNILMQGRLEEIQSGINAINKVVNCKIHLNIHAKNTVIADILNLKGVQINGFEGKHPVGNVSVQIQRLSPINKGDVVWYIDIQDLAIIGRFFLNGKVDKEKIIALAGPQVKNPQYFRVKMGACISSLVKGNISSENKLRYISGNVLTGKAISENGFLGAYDNLISVIKEGDYYEFLGWIAPGLKKFSLSRTFLSGFTNLLPLKQRMPAEIDTNLHGGKRALVLTGEYEKVFPLDIYPMQLIKACIIEDIDLMEQLGIYEVDAEDFALCEVIDVSKTDIQKIIRNGLELIRKEMGE